MRRSIRARVFQAVNWAKFRATGSKVNASQLASFAVYTNLSFDEVNDLPNELKELLIDLQHAEARFERSRADLVSSIEAMTPVLTEALKQIQDQRNENVNRTR